jgi:HlyD family secretion protein
MKEKSKGFWLKKKDWKMSEQKAKDKVVAGRRFLRLPYVVAVVLVLGLSALALVKWGPFLGPKSEAADSLFRVTQGNLLITVAATGDLKAKNSIKIAPEIEGRATIVYIVDEGIQVNKGDILVELDKADLEQRLADQEIGYQSAAANLIQAQEAKKIQEVRNQNDEAQARLWLKFAEADLKKYQAEFEKTERERKLAIERARTDLIKANDQLNIYEEQNLVEKGFKTQNEFEEVKFDVTEARNKLESAEIDLRLLLEFTHPRELADKEADIEEAKRNLEMVLLDDASQLKQREATILERQAIVNTRKERLDKAKEQLGKMTIRAPSPGLVIYGTGIASWRRERETEEIRVGGTAYQGRTLITLPDVTEMQVAAAVNEVDLPKVELGQRANIVIESLPHIRPTGTVEKIAALHNRQSWYASDVKEFDVDITVEGSEGLKPGISARVEIIVDSLRDVIYVPLEAVFERDGQEICYVAASEEFVARPVKTGKSNFDFVEIQQGLAVGEKVALFIPEGEKAQIILSEEKRLEEAQAEEEEEQTEQRPPEEELREAPSEQTERPPRRSEEERESLSEEDRSRRREG